MADLGPVLGDDLHAGARGRLELGERNAHARGRGLGLLPTDLGKNVFGADEVFPGFSVEGAAALRDGPHEAGLDGGGGVVDVVAVEAEPRFEAEAVARAEANGLDGAWGGRGG